MLYQRSRAIMQIRTLQRIALQRRWFRKPRQLIEHEKLKSDGMK
jgi:hypothetical protein